MSMGLRALIAVALMVGFYVFSLAAIAGLVLGAVGIALVGSRDPRAYVLVLMMLGLACLITWSLLPRSQPFVAPGPEITAEDQPALFAELRAIAEAVGQPMPRHVYVMLEVNAFVTQRGGFFGLGSRRVLGIGLPLFGTLTVEELRSVVAHELGHFDSGDVQLGPWIYRTRGALERVVLNLARFDAHGGWFIAAARAPFRAFFRAFMRITQAISRRQELTADATAARVAGKRPAREALRKIQLAHVAHDCFMHDEVSVLLELECVAPLREGFARYVAHPRIAARLAELAARNVEDAGPYDAHPPTSVRIAAIDALAVPDEVRPDPRAAHELVRDLEEIEAKTVAYLLDKPVEHIAWEDLPDVDVANWREHVAEHRAWLSQVRTDNFPIAERATYELSVEVLGLELADQLGPQELGRWWFGTFGSALAVALLDGGYQTRREIGAGTTFVRGDDVVNLDDELTALLRGELTRDAWLARWQARGLPVGPLA